MSAQVIINIVQGDVNKFNIGITTHKGYDSTEKELRIADKINCGIALLGEACAIICDSKEGDDNA